jgi:hypothetical protein
MITSRELAVEASITRTEVHFQTVQELDEDLAKHGLPPVQEIFKLDYRGTDLPEPDASEAAPEAAKDGK